LPAWTITRAALSGAAALSLAANAAGAAGTLAGYRQIVLSGHALKWGDPVRGSGASITWAIADAPDAFPGARNCPALASPDALLAASHIARNTFTAEVEAAFGAWSTVADISFTRGAPGEADILIGAEGIPAGRAFTNVVYDGPLSADAPASLSRAIICLNPAVPWKIGFDGNLDVYDLRYTLTHEIGHAIGLDHPGVPDTLMDFRYREAFRVPQLGDIAGAEALYGPPKALASAPGAALVRKVSSAD
jgi:hypothetical protein